MKKMSLLLAAIIGLYFGSGIILQTVYGDSFGFMEGEDCWKPDGDSGWRMHGNPTSEKPVEPSIHIPLLVNYIPIFLPASLLILFIFTPLSKWMEDEKELIEDSTSTNDEASS